MSQFHYNILIINNVTVTWYVFLSQLFTLCHAFFCDNPKLCHTLSHSNKLKMSLVTAVTIVTRFQVVKFRCDVGSVGG